QDTTGQTVQDTTELPESVVQEERPGSLTRALGFLKQAVKTIFFDYENINISFNNDNSLSKSGIRAQGTGFKNFWGFFHNDEEGPGRGFMLGLSDEVGPRNFRQGSQLSDVYQQKNSFDFKTARPLWEGAKIDINWKVGWTLN